MPTSRNKNLASVFISAAKRARAIARKQFFPPFAREPCDDQAVATVEYTEDGFRFVADGSLQATLCHKRFERVGFDTNKGWNLGRDGLLLMVLESPHANEFTPDLKPLGPAQGKTGQNIGNCMRLQHHRLDHLERVATGRYRLVLMNAIRYQCSLGVAPTSIYRDIVFRNLWEDGGRADFDARLKTYTKDIENHLTLICCTKGETILKRGKRSGKTDLSDLVYDAANTVVPADRLFRLPHPSSRGFCT